MIRDILKTLCHFSTNTFTLINKYYFKFHNFYDIVFEKKNKSEIITK